MRLLNLLNMIVVAGLVSVSISGCGSNDKEVSFKSGGMTQTFTDGSVADVKNFPLPIYPNAKPSGEVQGNAGSDDSSRFLMLASEDKVQQIGDFYTTKLKADGWAVSQKFGDSQLINLTAEKKDLDASVMISQDADGKTTINLALSKQAEGTPKQTGQVFTPDTLNPPTD